MACIPRPWASPALQTACCRWSTSWPQGAPFCPAFRAVSPLHQSPAFKTGKVMRVSLLLEAALRGDSWLEHPHLRKL